MEEWDKYFTSSFIKSFIKATSDSLLVAEMILVVATVVVERLKAAGCSGEVLKATVWGPKGPKLQKKMKKSYPCDI